MTIEYESLAAVNAPYAGEFAAVFDAVVRRGWFVLGEEVAAFEREFAAFVGVDHCAGVASGLDAITLSFRALGLLPGDEVILPSNTYVATILSALACGLTPVLVEPDLATYCIDPRLIEENITPKTRAICVVHLYGKPCDMTAIMAIAARRQLFVVEDCAQAHGARHAGRAVGAFGDCNAWSFYPTKNLGALGDGGGVTTSDAALCERVKVLRNYGSRVKYYNEVLGVNSRLDELQAALLRVKLRRIAEVTAHKRGLAARYRAQLKSDFILPVVVPGDDDVYHIFNVRHPRRDELRAHLLSHGVRTEIHYPVAPHRQKALEGIVTGDFPIAEEIHATTLSLPISTAHSAADIDVVCDVMNRF